MLGIIQIREVERYRTETQISQVEVICPNTRDDLFLKGGQASARNSQVDGIVAIRTIPDATKEALLISVQGIDGAINTILETLGGPCRGEITLENISSLIGAIC